MIQIEECSCLYRNYKVTSTLKGREEGQSRFRKCHRNIRMKDTHGFFPGQDGLLTVGPYEFLRLPFCSALNSFHPWEICSPKGSLGGIKYVELSGLMQQVAACTFFRTVSSFHGLQRKHCRIGGVYSAP